MTYLITFSCYGCHLHGGASGSVDWYHNVVGTLHLPEDPSRVEMVKRQMSGREGYLLGRAEQRAAVLEAIQEVCLFRGWGLLAAHVRMTHVHVVLVSDALPERVLGDFKAYASRALNGLEGRTDAKRWTRHGSTRWLWKKEEACNAIRYVVEGQGRPMAVFVSLEPF